MNFFVKGDNLCLCLYRAKRTFYLCIPRNPSTPRDSWSLEGYPWTAPKDTLSDEEGAVGGEDADDAEADDPEADDAEAQDAEANDDHTYTHKSSSATTSSAKLEPVNKHVDTYMKEHQCVCGYEVPSAQQLLIHNGLLHANKSYHCWGEWEKRDGTKYRCTYESDDEGQMWWHYRMQHLNIFYNWCLVQTCTYGALGGK